MNIGDATKLVKLNNIGELTFMCHGKQLGNITKQHMGSVSLIFRLTNAIYHITDY